MPDRIGQDLIHRSDELVTARTAKPAPSRQHVNVMADCGHPAGVEPGGQ
jgi:hypothetical protein